MPVNIEAGAIDDWQRENPGQLWTANRSEAAGSASFKSTEGCYRFSSIDGRKATVWLTKTGQHKMWTAESFGIQNAKFTWMNLPPVE